METLDRLVARYLEHGDEEAVEQVVRRTRERLARVARRIARDADVEDCLQTAYLSLTRKRGTSLDAPVLPWLVRAVVRIAYRHKARQQREQEIARRLGFAREDSGPPDAAVAEEETALVRRSIDLLPDAYRDPVVLHYLEGLSTAETARLLGITDANVRKRLERARALLRSALGPRVAGLLLPFPWLVRDGALWGGMVMQKPAVAAVVLLIAMATGALVWRGGGEPRAPERAPEAHVGHEADAEVEAAQRAVVSGRVTDREQRPIAGAHVLAIPLETKRAVDPRAPEPPTISGRTDAQGRFELPFEGTPLFYAAADGFSPEVTARTEIVLDPAGSIVGTVMDAERNVVAGARVRWMGLLGGVRIERETVSGPDGAYGLDGLPTQKVFAAADFGCGSWVGVRADGFAPLLFAKDVLPPGPGYRLDLVLVRGARVEGHVVDAETGAAIADARVVLFSLQARFVAARDGGRKIENPFAPGTIAETKSAADGSFKIEGVPAAGFHDLVLEWSGPQPWALGLVAADAQGYVARPETVAPPAPGATVDVRIACWPAAAVEGRVVDGSGRPLAGVNVFAYAAERALGDPRGEFGTRSVRTDSDGRYRLERVPAGREPSKTTVYARPPEWPSMIGGARSVEVDVRAGETASAPDIVVEGVDVPCVALVVTDSSGKPVPDARASFAHVGFGAPTDEEGRVRVYRTSHHGAGPPPLRVYVRAKGYAPQVTGEVEPALDPPEVRIVLRTGARIEGRVFWRDGTPAPGARVFVFNGDAATASIENSYVPYPQSEGLPLLTFYGSAHGGTDGSFVVEDLPEGLCNVQAGVAGATATVRGVMAGASDVRIELPALPPVPGETLEGTVGDALTGQPLLRFEAAVHDGTRRIEATYPALGTFRIADVPAGRWSLQVSARGYVPEETSVRVPGDGRAIPVVLRRGATVRGRLRNESGVDFGSVGFVDETGGFAAPATLGGDGAYRGVPLVPGRYRPVAWPREPSKREGPFRGPAPHFGLGTLVVREHDAEMTFDFTVRPCGGLSISIGLGQPKLYPDGTLRIEDEAGEPFLELRGNRALFARECFVPLGRYRVRLSYPGHEPQVRDVEVRQDARAEATFELP